MRPMILRYAGVRCLLHAAPASFEVEKYPDHDPQEQTTWCPPSTSVVRLTASLSSHRRSATTGLVRGVCTGAVSAAYSPPLYIDARCPGRARNPPHPLSITADAPRASASYALTLSGATVQRTMNDSNDTS